MGMIAFYEGNNGTESLVQTVNDNPGQDFQPVKAEIRSLRLFDVRGRCRIRIFDSADGALSNEFCIVDVKNENSRRHKLGQLLFNMFPPYTPPLFPPADEILFRFLQLLL
ncbi:hypothetical protein QFZ51_004095 [Chitinophaga sp. W3I9]